MKFISKISKKYRPCLCTCIGLYAAVFAVPVHAQDTPSESAFQMTGFLSITGGKTIGAASNAAYIGPTTIRNLTAPEIYVADWSNAGIYSNKFSFSPESRVGIQGNYKFDSNASVTGQIVARGSDTTPNVQWAFGSYRLNKNWEVQLGRKRIPLYYYSDFQDIGVSYPWVTPPPELYGWEVTNYNGASLRYNDNVGDANINSSIFTGSEKVKDSLYQSIYYNGKTEVTWKNIIGGDLEVNWDHLTMRGMYTQAKVRSINNSIALDDSADLKAFGVAINLDYQSWFILSEITQLSRDFTAHQYKVTAPAWTIGMGLRIGKWTPMVNMAQYKERSTDLNQYVPQGYRRSALVLRYDLDSNSAIKMQLDRQIDTERNFGGNVNVMRLSYDRSF